MANFRRRHPRGKTHARYDKWEAKKLGTPNWLWLGQWPKSWDLYQHTRPSRRAEERIRSAVLRGVIDPDNAAWPVHHRPHEYYW